MTNVLILAAEGAHDERDSGYPSCLTEVSGKPLIQVLVDQCRTIPDVRLIVAIQDEDCVRWHLDNVLAQLSPDAAVLRIGRVTAGAACTALLGVSMISLDEPLLILNGNEWIDIDLASPIRKFVEAGYDGGTVTFPSVHPRYSFVKIDDDGVITETAEKNPISKHATVGYYWFKTGRMFVEAAKRSILKNAHVNGLYYVCPTMNEMILDQAKLGVYPIDSKLFHPLKSDRQITRLEA